MNLATAANSTAIPTIDTDSPIDTVLPIDTTADDYIVSFSDVTVNLDRGTVLRGTKKVTLTAAELELLTFFVQNPDRALTRDMILDSVWSYLASPNTRTVDAHVLRLRQKLEAEPDSPRYFLTVHKVGYRFAPNGV